MEAELGVEDRGSEDNGAVIDGTGADLEEVVVRTRRVQGL